LTDRVVRALVDAAPDAIVVTDAGGRIRFVNDQAQTLFGYARRELLGQPVERLVPERFREAHVHHRTAYGARPRLRPMGAGIQLYARRKDGTEFPVDISLSPTATRGGLLVMTAIRDATERVRLLDELREHRDRLESLVEARAGELTTANLTLRREVAERRTAEERLREHAGLLAQERQEIMALNLSLEARERFIRSVIDSLRDGIAVLDPERRVVGCNAALETHTGVSLEEVRGQPFFDAFPGFRTEGLEPFVDRLYRDEQEAFVLERFQHVSGVTGPMILDIKGSVIRGARGDVEGVVLHVVNITDRVRLEQSVQESEKLAAIGALAAGVAHEINNPIGIMTSRMELILEEADRAGLPLPVRDDLQVLQRNAHRVGRITQGLLSFARRGSGGRQPTDLNAVVAETLLLFESHAVKAGVKVERRLAVPLPAVAADANQLQQVLLNLLNNARDALGDHGEIHVETGPAPTRPGWVRLAVTDTGPGIPPDLLGRVFVPFFTTKPGGTGLGLPISYRIVKDHGGLLEVQSEPGAGTAFSILLPALAGATSGGNG
jgi:PAS domain S-box-containing protein